MLSQYKIHSRLLWYKSVTIHFRISRISIQCALQLYCIKVLQENLIAKTIDNGCTHNLKPLRLKVLGEKKKNHSMSFCLICAEKSVNLPQ